MTDQELIAFVGITDWPEEIQKKFLDELEPAKRALYERMATLELEVDLWQEGLGPKPAGVLITYGGGRRGGKTCR